MFNIINLETGLPIPMLYVDGAAAAEDARHLTAETGKRHQPRPVLDTSWREREAQRLLDGTYTRVPWQSPNDNARSCEWFGLDGAHYDRYDYCKGKPETEHHYAHVSSKVPGNIAFTEDDAKGARDIQTSMKPGRYLARFYNLPDEHVRRYANEFIAMFGDIKLAFADTADEIERVYLNGPNSCMSHSASSYRSSEHPVRVYAAGDLAVAYITAGDGESEHISARALCWPARKIYGRPYGDEQKIAQLLEAQGYSGGDLDGARLLRIECCGAFIAPYIDWAGKAREKGKFLIIDENGDIDCSNTNGLSSSSGAECQNCGDQYDDENEGSYIHSRDERWCDCCTAEHAFYCDVGHEVIANGDGVLLDNGSYVSQRNFDRNGFTCEGTGARHMDCDDMVVLQDGTVWHVDYFADNGFRCDDCGECFANEDKHDLVGKDCSEDTCASCAELADDLEPGGERRHIARQGIDAHPGQLELPVLPPIPFNARVGDWITIEACEFTDTQAGTYEITQIDAKDIAGPRAQPFCITVGRPFSSWPYLENIISIEHVNVAVAA